MKEQGVKNGRLILVVDDSELNRAVLREMLSKEYRILEAENGVQALSMIKQYRDDLALVLLDLIMPEMDGFGVLEEMNRQDLLDEIPAIVITSETDAEVIDKAYRLGVSDFFVRPFNAQLIYHRVTIAVEHNSKEKRLVSMVKHQIYEKEQQSDLMIDILSHIVEFRNGESGLHVLHIRILTELLLTRLVQKTDQYQLSYSDIRRISMASALHDIGKVAIPEKILNKPARLTNEEFEIIKQHPEKGAQLLKDLSFHQDKPLLKTAYEICLWHHERYDGRGYPYHLVGDQIPITAQVTALADVYDALTGERVYKHAIPHEEALNMILNGECGAFNPLLLECLVDIADTLQLDLRRETKKHLDKQQFQRISSELLHMNDLSAAERTLYLLDYERMKYQFFAAIDEGALFEYNTETGVLTTLGESASRFGVPEFTFDPLRDLTELYKHYRRYPSFAVYCGGNEGRLGPYVEKRMYVFVKQTDPDRLVIHQDGDRCAWLEYDDEEGSNDPGNSDYDVGPRDVWPRGKFNTGRPFVCHEYLNLCVKQDTRIEPLYTGAWVAPDSCADRLAWLAERGLDAAWGDALQNAQHALQGVYQKRGIEWARKDPYCDGYCFWTAVDVVVANGPIHSAQGLFDPFWQTKKGGLSPERFALFNGTSVVLADFALECPVALEGDERKVTFLFANYDGAPKRDVAVRWSFSADGRVLLKGEEPVTEIAEGNARPIATAMLKMPSVAKAVKAELRAEVDGTMNEWDFWVFPKRARRDGSDIVADATLLPLFAKLYDGVADAASPVEAKARVVIAPYGSKTAVDALARGKHVLTVSAWESKPNISLGWWSMGNQVGTALAKDASALAGLPHEGSLTPLLFRVVKEGAYELSRKELKVATPIVVGEGKKDCYLYLGEVKAAKGRHMAAFGLDLFSGHPECTALLDGIVDVLRSW